MLGRFGRRDWLILVSLWLAAAALMCGLLVWFLALRPASQVTLGGAGAPVPAVSPTYTVPFAEITARRLYPAAEALARAWEPDAQLVGVNASWPTTAINLVGNATDWSFRFYSPAQARLYLVGVSQDGQVVGVAHFQKETNPPPVVNLGAWTVDSPEALARWLDYGGGALLGQNPGADVTIQLSAEPASGQPSWIVTGFDTTGSQALVVKVDAATGQVSIFGGEP